MAEFKLDFYEENIAQLSASSPLARMSTLYDLADKALAAVASQESESEKVAELEAKLLSDKSLLIGLVIKMKCQTENEIFEKIGFLNRAYLDEKRDDNFTPEDLLLESIYEDCQKFI